MNTKEKLLELIERDKCVLTNHKLTLKRWLFELMEKIATENGIETMLLTSPSAIYADNPDGKSQKLICPELAEVFYEYWHYIRPNAVSWSKKNGWKEL